MYTEITKKTKADMDAYCRTKWNGEGRMVHFFSEFEFERLRHYVHFRIYSGVHTTLPIGGGGFASYKFWLSDDKTQIFNYMPWAAGNPNGENNVYIYNNVDIHDGNLNDNPVVCHSESICVFLCFFKILRHFSIV